MTNLNSILKDFNNLKIIEKVVTYHFLGQYYNIPLPKKMIEKKINAIDERKSEADIDDCIFNSVLREVNNDCKIIQTNLFQRQINRDLLQTPEVIHYPPKSLLFETNNRKSSPWYSIIQKKYQQRNHSKSKNMNIVCFTSPNFLTKSRMCQKRARITENNRRIQKKTHFVSTTIPPANRDYLTQKSSKSKCLLNYEQGDNKIKQNRQRNRSNFNLAQTPIIPLTSLGSSKNDKELKINSPPTEHNKERVLYEEIPRELIDPIHSFTIYKPQLTIQKIQKLYNLKSKINLHKGEIKEYLTNITLKRSTSNKKKIIFLLAPQK